MTQKQRLLEAMRRGPVTTRDAMLKMGIYRCSERIRELSADGHHIEIDYPTVKGRCCRARVARYWLVKERKA